MNVVPGPVPRANIRPFTVARGPVPRDRFFCLNQDLQDYRITGLGLQLFKNAVACPNRVGSSEI